MRYDWLLLDADGTLFDYDSAERQALQASFVEFEQPFAPNTNEVYRRINKLVWDAVEAGTVAEGDLPVRRFALLAEALGLRYDAAAFGEAYLRHLGEHADLLPGAEETLAALYGRVGMVVVTNGITHVQHSRFALTPITRYLSAVVISGEEGVAKPDARIFDAALARAGNPPRERVLMVGDSLSADMVGGRNAGLDTCWFNPARLPRDARVQPTHEIRQLAQLLALVETGAVADAAD